MWGGVGERAPLPLLFVVRSFVHQPQNKSLSWNTSNTLACPRVPSLAPYLVSFPCFLLVSLQHPLVSSGNPGETPWNSSFWGGSEPCLRLFWGQNRQNTGYFAGIPDKPRVYLENTWVSCRFPQFCPRFCPRPALRLRETREFPEARGKLERNRMEHQTPSGFPGNFRKRKVLGTLWFPSGLPETLGHRPSWSGAKSEAKMRKSTKYPGGRRVISRYTRVLRKIPGILPIWPKIWLILGPNQPQTRLRAKNLTISTQISRENREEKRACCREKRKGKQMGCERKTSLSPMRDTHVARAALLMFCASPQTAARESCCE